ncbi:MAG: zinc ribbon domain-containing protein [Deltaproteobacteria bacterium]|nr:zinc ribbon domain-containing protein [Deltaproteobacteria bacterium]
MPLYEFRCEQCGSISEFLAKMGETGDGLICPHCGSSSLVKKMSVAALPSFSAPDAGKTCCGRDERCDSPPCGTNRCCRDK